MRTSLRTLALLALLSSCAAPGVALVPQADDFAFLEIDLRG